MSALNSELAIWFKHRLADPLRLEQAITHLSDQWGSEIDNHRVAIRSAVGKALLQEGSTRAAVNERDLESLANLREIPRLKSHALSISHCPDLGGFILVPNLLNSVGFDIEISSRIKIPIAARVLPHAKEAILRDRLADASAAPLATSIWAAKESAIKCFGNAFAEHTVNYTNVELVSLDTDQNSGFTFTARFENGLAHGLVANNGQHVFALAVRNSS